MAHNIRIWFPLGETRARMLCGLTAFVLVLAFSISSLKAEEAGRAVICPVTKPSGHSGGAGEIAPWARESYCRNYQGHYVGGGVAYGIPRRRVTRESRYVDEGTFGMDYDPWWSRVGLMWSHGSKYQSGHGAYETDKKNNGFPNWFRR